MTRWNYLARVIVVSMPTQMRQVAMCISSKTATGTAPPRKEDRARSGINVSTSTTVAMIRKSRTGRREKRATSAKISTAPRAPMTVKTLYTIGTRICIDEAGIGRSDTAAMAMTALTTTEAMIAKRPTSQRRPQAMRSTISEPVDEFCVCVFVVDNFLFFPINPH